MSQQFLVDLEYLIAIMPGHVYWKDSVGKYCGCNELQAKDLGLDSPKDIIGKTDDELSSPQIAKAVQENDKLVIESGQSITVEEATDIGDRQAPYLSKKVPLKDASGNICGILGISFDISEHKQERRAIENTLDAIISMLPGHVFWMDNDNVFLGCNDLQAKAAGFQNASELIDKSLYDIFSKSEADALAKINRKVIESDKEYTIEEPGTYKSGEKRIFLSKKVPLKRAGCSTGVLGVAFDITAEKQHVEQLEREKLVAEKQSEVMKLMSSAIAHELRTPQASIDMACENLKESWPALLAGYKAALDAGCEVPDIPELVYDNFCKENIGERLIRINNNCRTIINMMNKNVLQGQLNGKSMQFSPKQTIDNTIKDYPYRNSGEKRIIKGVLGDDFAATGDPELFTHVILNLLKNAIYHVLHCGKGHIEIRLVAGDDYNMVYFEDTGPGISQENINKIFNSFFTKNTDNGTGVGLSLCKNVIENNMHGKIWCESELGKYTRFCLQLPKANDTNQMD